jgi:hypothetical protein
MRVRSPLLFLMAFLAMALALQPFAARAHCGNSSAAGASYAAHHGKTSHHHQTRTDPQDAKDKKAADCLLRCIAACAGTVVGSAETGRLIAFPLRHPLPAAQTGEGLIVRPLVPPPQVASL